MKFHHPYVSGQMPLPQEEVSSMTPTMENAVAEQTDHQQPHIEASVTASVIPNGPLLTPSPSSSPLRPTPPLPQTPPPPERAGTQVWPTGAKNVDLSYFDSMPPGYRFSPLDEELVVYYLQNKVFGQPLPRNRIIEVNLYAHNPEKLAEEYRQFGEKEWYFFTPRDKKYRNGCRPNRAAGDGYWKATGADRPVYHRGNVVGSRKALVFYSGKAPKGDKTNWIMHEFRVKDAPLRTTRTGPNDMRLDDWVLCRIYKKLDKNSGYKNNHIGRGRHKDEDHISPTHHDYGDVINGVDVHDHNLLSVDAMEPHYGDGNNTSVDALEPHYGCDNNTSVDAMEPHYGCDNNTSVDAMEPHYGGGNNTSVDDAMQPDYGNSHTASLMYANTSSDYFEPTASFHNRSLNNYNNFHTLVSNFAAHGNRMTMVESADVDPIPLIPMMHIEPSSVIDPGYLNHNVTQNSNYVNQNCLIGSNFRRVASTGAPYPNVVSLDKIVQPHNLGPDSHI